VSIAAQIVQIAEYETTGDPEDYVAAITDIVGKVERDGVAAMTRYTFYVDRAGGTVTSVIVHESPESWAAHHEMLERWHDEFARLKRTAHQTRLRLYGPVSDAMRSWLGARGVRFEEAGTLAAGFER
jgi:hypothetical protein